MDFCSGRPRAAGYQRPPSRARAPELLAPNKEFVHGFIDVGNLFNRHRRRIETALKMTATVCSVNAFFSVLVFYKHCATKEQNVIFRGCLWFNGNLACGWPCFDIYLCVINFAVFCCALSFFHCELILLYFFRVLIGFNLSHCGRWGGGRWRCLKA